MIPRTSLLQRLLPPAAVLPEVCGVLYLTAVGAVVQVRICEELGRAKIKDMLDLLSGRVLNCCGLNLSGGGSVANPNL